MSFEEQITPDSFEPGYTPDVNGTDGFDQSQNPLQVPNTDVTAVGGYLPDWLGGATALEMRTEIMEDLEFWFPQTGTTCGPASLTSIIEDFTGRDFSNEFAVRDWAAANGHYTEGFGMLDDGALATLEHFGVPAHQETGDWRTVDRYLEEGRAVVLSVDASEYWGDPSVPDNSYHYVRVLDVDLDRQIATLSDTGAENGYGMQVPLSLLEKAWDESDETALSPEDRASLVHGMIVSDVVDPDGVGAQQINWDKATTNGAIDPTNGFALLPLMLSKAGLATLRTASHT